MRPEYGKLSDTLHYLYGAGECLILRRDIKRRKWWRFWKEPLPYNPPGVQINDDYPGRVIMNLEEIEALRELLSK